MRRLRQRVGDPERVPGEAPSEHHQLLHRVPSGGRPARRRLRYALLRLCSGKETIWWVVPDIYHPQVMRRAIALLLR